jgi:hypothetical protein
VTRNAPENPSGAEDLRLVDLKGTVEKLPLPAVAGNGKATA